MFENNMQDSFEIDCHLLFDTSLEELYGTELYWYYYGNFRGRA